MNYEEKKSVFEQNLARYVGICRDLAAWLGEHPEISRQEKESSRRITEILEQEGFSIEGPVGLPYSFRAVKKPEGKKYKHTMAVLTEFDALPGLGHACGHNVSCAVSVLAGLALNALQDELDTEIRIVGTPQEEVVTGKVILADAGAFDGCEFAMMVHMDADNISYPIALATTSVNVVYHGRSAHASAAPWMGQNALNGARLTLDAIDMLRQHIRPGCQIHGVLADGGVVTNIIPDRAELRLQLRAQKYEELLELRDRLLPVIEAAARAAEVTCDIDQPHEPVKDLKFNEAGDAFCREAFRECGLPLSSSRIFASTDAGELSYRFPVLHPLLKIAPAGTALHTTAMEQCARSETALDSIANGARIIGYTVMKIFENEENFKAVQACFEQK